MKNNFISTPILLLILICFCSCKNRNSNKSNEDKDHVISELKTVLINGDSFSYMDIGKGEPVVFVHGSLGDYRTWEAQMDAFAKNHRVIAYSRRFAYPDNQVINDSIGHSVTAHAKDLTQFIKILDIGPVHLVGHSKGAFTSLLTALEHPELLQSLTLGEPPVMSLLQNVPDGSNLLNDFVAKTIIPTAEAFKNNDDKKALATFIAGVHADSLYFSKASQQQNDIMIDNIGELKAELLSGTLFPPLDCDEIKTLKMPVLLLKGDRSPEFLTQIIDELDSCIANNELVTLPNSSHGLELENPEEFNKIVLDFISKH